MSGFLKVCQHILLTISKAVRESNGRKSTSWPENVFLEPQKTTPQPVRSTMTLSSQCVALVLIDAADTEGDNGMSRTSSVSTNNRSNLGKRGKAGRQRRDDSDSFDSRNHYTPYWGSQQPTWVQQTPPAQGNQFVPAQYAQIYQQGPVGYMNQPVAGAMPNMPPMVPKQSHTMYQGPQVSFTLPQDLLDMMLT